MSWDKHSDQPSSYGSRPSNTLARLAFNIYGSSNNSSSSNSRAPSFSARQSPPSNLAPVYEISANDSSRIRYKVNSELVGLCKLNYDADNVAIAGKNTLQVLKVGSTVVPTEDLLTSNYYMKNKKAIGTILDVKTGYGVYNKYIGTSTTTGSILIFNAGSKNKLLFRYSEQMRAVNTISFSQLDAYSLLSGSQDGAMKLWDLRSANGKPVLTIQSNTDAIRSIQFSPYHNRKFAAISDSGVILKWDLRLPAQFEKKFNAHTGPGLCLDWHPEFDYIVSAGRDKQVQVWNMNADSRVPEHAIYSASPVSKVSWRPISSNSISGAELAMSFLNNDLTVQVYSLRRKYIPLYTIESHQAQVTGLSFKDDRYLYTCSKDKFFCKEDLALQPHTIDNLPLTAVSWAPNNDFLFVDQQKKTADLEKESEHSTAAYPSQPMSTSPSSPANASGINSSSYLSHDSSPRPGMSRASSLRPGLNRGHSQNSHFHQSLAPVSVVNPTAVPVTLPIMKAEPLLQYLADNYVFDSNDDLIGSCIKNSTTASEAGNHRDAQTWNVIKESLLWEQQLGEDIEYNDPPPVVGNDTVSMRSDSVHEKYHYSTSNSTNLGKSPTLSDLSEFNSLNSREQSIPNKEHRLSIIKSIKSKNSFSGIEESEEEESDHAKSLLRADVIKWSDRLRPMSADITTDADGTITKDENEEAIEFTDTITKPITLPHRKRSARNSLLEAVLPNESSPGARSSSPTYSLTSSMSGTSTSVRPLAAAWSTALNRQTLSKQTSHMSELTRQLTNQILDDDIGKEDKFAPPFAPRQMISKAVEFSSGQGDLIMSCTLLLLFNDKYHIFSDNMMKNYIYQYLQFLQRLRFWVTMTKILGSSKYEEFKQMSANSTTVRRFCSKCGVLVVNEITKEKFLKDPKVQFGAWFCERCGCRSKCIYCNEPLKGLNIFRLKCGHNGHFGCFKSWVLDEGMDCCPGGC